FGAWAVIRGVPSANTWHAREFIPDLTDLSSLNLWASIAFAFAGLELSATMGGEVENAERNLPRSIFISAPLVASAYILGTVALLMSVLGRGTTVETVYLILLDTQLLIYFIPFVYLFVALIILRKRDLEAGAQRGMASALLIGGCGAVITMFAMVIATIPP